MRRKKELLTQISQRLDIPREALPFGFGMTLSGQESLTVRGCNGILSYEKSCVRLSLGKVALDITGKGLICTAFEAGNMTVEGHIRAISFEEDANET